jgi:hypothetical protein
VLVGGGEKVIGVVEGTFGDKRAVGMESPLIPLEENAARHGFNDGDDVSPASVLVEGGGNIRSSGKGRERPEVCAEQQTEHQEHAGRRA